MSNLLVALARIRPLEDPVKDRLAGRLLRRREVRRPDALRRVLAKDDLLSDELSLTETLIAKTSIPLHTQRLFMHSISDIMG